MWPNAIAGATLLSQEARRHFYSEARLSRGLIYISPLLVKGAEVVRGSGEPIRGLLVACDCLGWVVACSCLWLLVVAVVLLSLPFKSWSVLLS